MRTAWHNLEKREQMALGLGGVCVSLFLAYTFVLAPLSQYHSRLKQAQQENQRLIPWMQSAEKRLQNASSGPKKDRMDKSTLLSSLSLALQNTSFKRFPYTLRQTAAGAELRFERVPFSLCMHWLWKLQNRHAIKIEQIDAKSTNESGIVELEMRLSI